MNTQEPYKFELPTESDFRSFCREKWYEHRDEILAWTGRPLTEYDSDYYFRKHRWMLKSMYKDLRRSNVRSTTV